MKTLEILGLLLFWVLALQPIKDAIHLFLSLADLLDGQRELFILIEEESEQTVIVGGCGAVVNGGCVIASIYSKCFPIKYTDR